MIVEKVMAFVTWKTQLFQKIKEELQQLVDNQACGCEWEQNAQISLRLKFRDDCRPWRLMVTNTPVGIQIDWNGNDSHGYHPMLVTEENTEASVLEFIADRIIQMKREKDVPSRVHDIGPGYPRHVGWGSK